MNEPLVSIIMPVYNGEKYIAHAIESCISQIYSNWELIIVDDGSTDATASIIEHFERPNPRIRSIRNVRNLKLPGAFNEGYKIAKGEYYSWLSSDDSYHPRALEAAVAVLNSDQSVDLVYSDFFTVDDTGNAIRKITVKEPEILATRNSIGPFRVYRRKVHEMLEGYDESLFLVEDYDFLLRAFCLFTLRRLQEPLYQFRLHESGLTSTHADQVPVMRDLAKEKNLPLLKKKSFGLAARCHLSLIDSNLSRNNSKRARYHALGAICCSPFFALSNIRLILAAFIGAGLLSTLHPKRT